MEKPLTIDKDKVGFFRFKKTSDEYLITNDLGQFSRLKETEFYDFIQGRLDQNSDLYDELAGKFFIKNRTDPRIASYRYRDRYSYLQNGPSLHIIVVTLRCNYKCVYCQANRRDSDLEHYDMSKDTAKNTVDRIFESPGKAITIEFQGGEPLLNWPVVRFIIEYAREKNKENIKDLRIALVSNLSCMTEETYDFLIANKVSICTSLDGPEDVHNKNRPCPDMNSYQATADWIKKIRKKESLRTEAENEAYPYKVSALLTITRNSLKHLRRIIDEYIKYDFKLIALRRLSFLGLSGGPVKEFIGYSSEEFISAWKDAMDYIIDINLKGRIFGERMTTIFLQKILTPQDPGFLDLRSPCGAGIGQLAYNYDGKVYTCDEARMLEDDTFLLGDVNKQDYPQIISSPRLKAMVLSSTLENFSCDECVYKPYCGICPVMNYVFQGTIFPQIPCTEICRTNSAMLDYMFEKLKDNDILELFQVWARIF